MRSEPDPAVSFGWVPVLFVESQTQLLSSAKSLHGVERERDSVFLLGPVVVHIQFNSIQKNFIHKRILLTSYCIIQS